MTVADGAADGICVVMGEAAREDPVPNTVRAITNVALRMELNCM
jgi:hypothetical protein